MSMHLGDIKNGRQIMDFEYMYIGSTLLELAASVPNLAIPAT